MRSFCKRDSSESLPVIESDEKNGEQMQMSFWLCVRVPLNRGRIMRWSSLGHGCVKNPPVLTLVVKWPPRWLFLKKFLLAELEWPYCIVSLGSRRRNNPTETLRDKKKILTLYRCVDGFYLLANSKRRFGLFLQFCHFTPCALQCQI